MPTQEASIFSTTYKNVDKEIYRFRKKTWKEEEKIRNLVKDLAETIKDDISPLVAVEAKKIKGPLFEVIEYSLLDFQLYKSTRYSDELATVYEYPKKTDSKELSVQSLSDRREYQEGWLKGYGEKAVESLEKVFGEKEIQVPTFSLISDCNRRLIFSVIPQPTRGTFFDAYLKEISLMKKRGAEARIAYST